ncbi:TetR family transcriptional regulator [Rhodococcoides trifolii]|uniref:TetR family transcriptional regulator n=1 Tax=Rhodococcoides trifolii TaxID=908250 RepID=A0A917G5B2_9NOCA|nr:TetR/AcrR family transcriptional regulator [Rhodococcus trifolii]GGG23885.1 TetR family transcriptional regulator [Rhodococcus trifolii]
MATDRSDAPVSRVQRRKAQTRQALLDAARTLLADGNASTASIAEITSAADVGFGSFYNHFDDKPALFAAAVEQVLEQWGDLMDTFGDESGDPAQTFVTSFRMSARVAFMHRQEAEIIARSGFGLLDSATGLGPRALRDLTAAVDAGRLTIPNIELATAVTGGNLLALIHLWLKDETSVAEADIDYCAEQLLIGFGADAETAKRLAYLDLS